MKTQFKNAILWLIYEIAYSMAELSDWVIERSSTTGPSLFQETTCSTCLRAIKKERA